ncbi:hypothetical protein [Arthrobacter sp. FW306-2-2C-D06B]|uniref:hypothetical protein n=1 Tax=Arthrobacter sp. FW306-2-2C-D06B TaxID=2879618 RepID=UPI001F45C5A3|nr:hypothetical protein [Arthrobacter sp. FW306-2-2C-D06B]UKA57509.1 hypothetical protein LFT47_14565 [Arthrobacter sp. FW306-2-2C-D06B]
MDTEVEVSTEVQGRILSPVSYEVFVDRIELVRHYGGFDKEKERLNWDVYLYPVPSNGKRPEVEAPNFLLVGHLFRANESGHGQVRANALVRAFELDGMPMNPEFVRDRLAYGFVEATYDTCRRALQAQSAVMDVDLDLPKVSPPTKVQLDDEPPKAQRKRKGRSGTD